MTMFYPPPFPSNPVPGQQFQNWVWNGSMWTAIAPAPTMNIRAYRLNDTYWPSPGVSFVVAECLGGGGAGGGVQFTFTGTIWKFAFGGGGGGAGSYSRARVAGSLVAGGVAVVVGGGGVGQPAMQGGAGSVSSFGQFGTAPGGGGGANNTVAGTDSDGVYSGEWGLGGAGGAAGVGDFHCPGNSGFTGPSILDEIPTGPFPGYLAVQDAKGGAGYFGGAPQTAMGIGGGLQTGQSAAANTGAGGGGAVGFSGGAATAIAGGNGGSGVVIVTEYVLGSGAQPVPPPCSCGCNPCKCWWPTWGCGPC